MINSNPGNIGGRPSRSALRRDVEVIAMLATSGSFWIALVVSTFVIALLSAAIQVTTLRPLLGRDPLTTILATFGVQLNGILPRRAHQLSDPRLPLVLDLFSA